MHDWLQSHWYRDSWLTVLLLPVAWLFRLLVHIRYLYYRFINRKRLPLPVPVIVVGNISVGGTGKTPLVIYLARWLVTQGHRPGIVTRGYAGKSKHWPLEVVAESDAEQCGDEPVLLARGTGCPVVAAPDRVEACELLLSNNNCTVILCDDGLQHYALKRQIEIAVVDGIRRHGNGHCLPAGPLREPLSRLGQVDYIVVNGSAVQSGEYVMDMVQTQVNNLVNTHVVRSLEDFNGSTVHAVAAIGHVERFYSMLERSGINLIRHEFADHHPLTPEDITFADSLPVLMTEKDAVKCYKFATDRHWAVCIDARPEESFLKALLTRIENLKDG